MQRTIMPVPGFTKQKVYGIGRIFVLSFIIQISDFAWFLLCYRQHTRQWRAKIPLFVPKTKRKPFKTFNYST